MNLVSIVLVLGGWLLFVASFFLPATAVMTAAGGPGDYLLGWEIMSFTLQGGTLHPFVLLAAPQSLALFAYVVVNLVVVACPVLLYSRSAWLCVGGVLMFAPLPILDFPTELRGTLLVGFYCWMFAYVLVGLGFVLAGMENQRRIRQFRERVT